MIGWVSPAFRRWKTIQEIRRVNILMVDHKSRASAIQFKWLTPQDITPRIVDQWSDLSRSACTPNVYLSPEFLVPALNFLRFDSPPRIAAAWSSTRGEMLALGVFATRKRSLMFPFRSMEFAKSVHSFQSGLLLREDLTDENLDLFLGHVLASGCKAIFISEMTLESTCFERIIASAKRHGLSWSPQYQYQRPALVNGDDLSWRNHISGSMLRQMRRNRRKLEQLGKVEVRLVMPDKITTTQIDTFLNLENSGWKHASSLLSDMSQTKFFRSAVQRLRESNSVFFVELTVGERVIASTVNFYIREHGFAFKIGWDSAYRRFTPGYLVEYGLLEFSASGGLPVQYLESGSSEGSYLDALWPGRITMVSGILVSGACARIVLRMTNIARQWIRGIRAAARR